MLTLPPNLAALSLCAAKESARYSMCGVHLIDTQDGNYCAVATDGRTLSVVRGPCPGYEDLQDAPDELPEFTVPTATWEQGFKLLKGRDRRFNGGVEPALLAHAADGRVALSHPSAGTATGTLEEGRYPTWRDVFPKRKPLYTVNLNPHLLIQLLRSALPFLDDETRRMSLHYYGPNTVVGLTCRNQAGQFWDGLIMPLT